VPSYGYPLRATNPTIAVCLVHFYKQIFNPDPANFSSKIPPG